LIRVGYAGVNASDSKTRSGQSARAGYRYREINFPFVTGLDAAGVVERTGSNVTEFSQGDRVITWSAADGKTWGSSPWNSRVKDVLKPDNYPCIIT
jgi:NADPH:quinone reductase